MTKNFKIKGLPESDEIQQSYDERDYFNTVLKCRVFLESWLSEYIYALLFPSREEDSKDNRQFVTQRFSDMFYQIQWLEHGEYINKNDYNNLNRLRIFSENVFRKGDVLAKYTIKDLNDFVLVSVHYCQKYKNLTQRIIEMSAAKAF